MKKLKLSLIIVSIAMFLAGCGTRVEIPPAHVGKILGKNGYLPETLTPSKFRLPMCFVACDKLVLLQTSDSALKEPLKIFMPQDKLNLAVDIRGTFSIPQDEKTISTLYSRIPATNLEDSSMSIITAKQVYETYGRQAVRGIVRSELADLSIQEVLKNRAAVGQNIRAAIEKKLRETGTPIQITRFELADVQPPEVIVKAQESAKEREIDIQRANADAEVALVEAQRALEVAKAERATRKENALALAEENRIAAESVSPKLLEYQRLQVSKEIFLALSKSGNSIIIPADMKSFNTAESSAFAKIFAKELKGRAPKSAPAK